MMITTPDELYTNQKKKCSSIQIIWSRAFSDRLQCICVLHRGFCRQRNNADRRPSARVMCVNGIQKCTRYCFFFFHSQTQTQRCVEVKRTGCAQVADVCDTHIMHAEGIGLASLPSDFFYRVSIKISSCKLHKMIQGLFTDK